MAKEEKTLLLRDLCARLLYNVMVDYENHIYVLNEIDPACKDIDYITVRIQDVEKLMCAKNVMIEHIKPYLRPMSSMTEEEKKIMRSCGFELIPYDTGYTGFANIENCIDEISFRFMEEFLNAHHFDYRGLIPMNLALEAPEGMYNKH